MSITNSPRRSAAQQTRICGRFLLPTLLLLLLLLATGAAAEVPLPVDPLQPATTGGLAEVDRALARLSTHQRLLVVAAHPDDEDTALLTYVARALGGESAYLSLSRGDGGQNLIGDELGIGLGLLRSRELEAARRIDGARQYFSRAYDFGYTRSLDETLERWPEAVLLEDALRVIRRFRPQVIVAIFPADARAGHGQHQASGLVARRAFDAALDDVAPPRSFLRAGFFLRRGDVPSFTVSLGVVEPFSGRSVFQIAMESRSQHRCQDMGLLQPLGDAEDRLVWEAGASRESLFGGIDTSLSALADPLADPELRRRIAVELDAVETLARDTRDRVSAPRVGVAVEPLAEIVRRLRRVSSLLETPADAEGDAETDAEARDVVRRLVAEKEKIAAEALASAARIGVDAWTDRETATPGSEIQVEAVLWNAGSRQLESDDEDGGPRIELVGEGGEWTSRPAPADDGGRGFFSTEPDLEDRRLVRVPDDVRPTAPYFLHRPLDGDLYDWRGVPDGVRGEPFGPPPLRARFHLEIAGVPVALEREVVHRRRDQARGEVRRPLRIVPAVEVSLDRDLLVVSSELEAAPPLVEVRVRSHASEDLDGELHIELTGADPAVPRKVPMHVPLRLEPGEVRSHPIDVTVLVADDLEPGRYSLRARFQLPVAGETAAAARTWSGGIDLVDYQHIRPVSRPVAAELDLVAAPIALPDVDRIAYVRGASDRVPEMLEALGLPVEIVRAEDLEDAPAAELAARYDALVIGSRAYEVDPALPEINERLLDYARVGGRLVVQYQQYGFSRGAYAPYPLEILRPHDRITDETGPVRLLRPDHPIFHHPNDITAADWEGWVQERGLYFAGTWDDAYTPLLALEDPVGDPGGEEKQGGLLVADLGEGRYVYTGLAFFRQLPAGVPGAYRIFLNLLSADDGEPAQASR